ncbi:MAG: secondary thiamine-phosphate synthase enzyme YjbQ [Deltaproteobacteria bacterium]|jgi:secondary thiamine-phosphate synthase enzyme|nr:secondary thiamine-phosphate synthase enzyme YjbQ [Deltaproteobacteria bacterium]
MGKLYSFSINTPKEGFVNITSLARECLVDSGIRDGFLVVFVPHTTAAVTINENADPDVQTDLLLGLSKAFPADPAFRHAEGNSPAHLKASVVGSSVTVMIDKGALVLGTWQAIYFCEFDGPRTRKCYFKLA